MFEKPKNEENKKEDKIKTNENKMNKDIENRELEQNSELLCQSPAPISPLLGKTFCSEEDRIRYELAKINENSNIGSYNNEKNENKFINTSNGYG